MTKVIIINILYVYMIKQTTSLITVNVDKKTKEEANKIFKELGLNMSTAINIYLKTCIKENGIPFLINKKED